MNSGGKRGRDSLSKAYKTVFHASEDGQIYPVKHEHDLDYPFKFKDKQYRDNESLLGDLDDDDDNDDGDDSGSSTQQVHNNAEIVQMENWEYMTEGLDSSTHDYHTQNIASDYAHGHGHLTREAKECSGNEEDEENDDTDNEDMQSMSNNTNMHFQQEELTNGGIESSSHCNALVLTSKKRSNRCLDFPVDSLVDELILKTRRTALQTQGVSQGTEIIPIYHQPIVYHHNLLSNGDDGYHVDSESNDESSFSEDQKVDAARRALQAGWILPNLNPYQKNSATNDSNSLYNRSMDYDQDNHIATEAVSQTERHPSLFDPDPGAEQENDIFGGSHNTRQIHHPGNRNGPLITNSSRFSGQVSHQEFFGPLRLLAQDREETKDSENSAESVGESVGDVYETSSQNMDEC
jgi:hypothetical protein